MFGLDRVTVVLDGRKVLSNVSLNAEKGTVTTIVGGDGAGKTTVLKALAGRVRPAVGTVSGAAGRDVGMLPAEAGSWANLTVRQNLEFVASAMGLTPSRDKDWLDELIARAGLESATDRLASQLSGGMRRKLGTIMALVGRPRLLLLDEPSTGVDPVSRVELWRLISHAAADGAAVVTTTTYLDEAERAAHVVALSDGRVLGQGDPAAVLPGLRVAPRKPGPARAGRGEPLLSVRGLRKSFGDFEAVAGVDLEVRPGEVVGLLGANGAGKSTLVRCALGLLAPSEGEALLFGEAPSRQTRARLGYVSQGRGLYTDLTAAQNAQFAAQLYGSARPAGHTAADGNASQAALPNGPVGSLPLGEQRRLAFRIASDHGPELLVLDEPTSGVGPAEAARLWEMISAQAVAGVGVLVTTHNMGEAGLCDRLALMVDGQVIAAGTQADIVGDATVVSVTSPT